MVLDISAAIRDSAWELSGLSNSPDLVTAFRTELKELASENKLSRLAGHEFQKRQQIERREIESEASRKNLLSDIETLSSLFLQQWRIQRDYRRDAQEEHQRSLDPNKDFNWDASEENTYLSNYWELRKLKFRAGLKNLDQYKESLKEMKANLAARGKELAEREQALEMPKAELAEQEQALEMSKAAMASQVDHFNQVLAAIKGQYDAIFQEIGEAKRTAGIPDADFRAIVEEEAKCRQFFDQLESSA